MMKIWKILPTLAPVLAVGGVAAGAAAGLGSYTVPAYGAEEFRIPGGTEQVSQRKNGGEKRVQQPAEAAESAKTGETKGEKTKKEKSKGSFQLADGTYEGTGTGYYGEIKVSVNIQDQSIDAIDVLSHSDDEAFFSRAKEGVVGSILTRQTTEVDTVTGATYSSKGIIQAVKNALKEDTGGSGTQNNAAQPAAPTGSQGPGVIGQGNLPYADGTYEGSAPGFSGEVKVSVTVKNKTITDIQILSHSDDESFFGRAREGVVGSILSSQKLEVDAVSGATYSSNGIINAVKNALSGAESPAEGQHGSTPLPTKKPGAEQKPETTKTPEVSPGAAEGIFPYPDGTYTGTGEGFGGKITVKVRIKKKAIVSVVVKEHADEDDGFFNRAKTLVDQIVKNQSVDIDAVSGATYSSKGILEAVRNALKEAEKAAVTGVPSATDTPAAAGTPPVTESPAASGTPLPSPSPGLDYKDGLYTASALCSPDEYWDFDPYNLNLTVVLSGGRITAIRNIYGDYEDDAADNDSYVNRAANGSSSAPGVVSQIVEKNSAEGIDTVSHATCSSRAIIEACRQALLKAQ